MNKVTEGRRCFGLAVFLLICCLACSALLNAGCSILDPGPARAHLLLEPSIQQASGPGASDRPGQILDVQLSVAQVESISALNSSRIAVLHDRQLEYLPDVQWVEPAPRIVQAGLIRSLSASRRLSGVGGDNTLTLADYQLHCLMEGFQVVTEFPQPDVPDVAGVMHDGPVARVYLTLHLVHRNGRVLDYIDIIADSPARSMDVRDIQDAFEAALSDALARSTAWTLKTLEAAQ